MAQYITRTINEIQVTAYALRKVKGKMQMVSYGPITVVGTTLTDADAKKKLRAAGFEVPSTAVIETENTGTHTYAMTVSDFMKYAKEINRD